MSSSSSSPNLRLALFGLVLVVPTAVRIFYKAIHPQITAWWGVTGTIVNETTHLLLYPENEIIEEGCTGNSPSCTSWFLNEPFKREEPFPGGIWVQLSPQGIEAARPIFNMSRRECLSSRSRCCLGMSHNGGNHAFKHKGDNVPFENLMLRAMRSDFTFFPVSQGRDLLLAFGNRTVAMMGDSKVHQIFLSIECAARRAGCDVIRYSKNDTEMGLEDACPKDWRKGTKMVEIVTMSCAPNHATRLLFGRAYQPCISGKRENEVWREKEMSIWDKMEADVVILSPLGAHYEQCLKDNRSPSFAKADFESIVKSSLFKKWLRDPRTLVLYLESGLGHSATPGGEFCESSYGKRGGKFINSFIAGLNQSAYENLGGRFGCYPVVFDENATKNWLNKLAEGGFTFL